MRTAVILFTLLTQLVLAEREQVLSIIIFPLIEPEAKFTVRFDHEGLSTLVRGEKSKELQLTAKQKAEFGKLLADSPKEGWSGEWISTRYLDGFTLIVNYQDEKGKRQFIGRNGCPPGFSGILKAISGLDARCAYFKGWEEMEKSAKQYRSFSEFVEVITKNAIEKESKKANKTQHHKSDRAGD